MESSPIGTGKQVQDAKVPEEQELGSLREQVLRMMEGTSLAQNRAQALKQVAKGNGAELCKFPS